MNKKKIMIMGAGIYQVPLIKKAKEMGLETLVVSVAGKYPGIPLADHFYEVDTRNKEAVLTIAMQEEIAAICTSGTDVAVKTIGYVNEKMGLTGISYQAACLVTDKADMKSAFRTYGVSTAAFERVSHESDAAAAAEKIGYPVMVKAVDSSGSRGIKKVKNEQELIAAYAEAKKVTRKDYILIEEYIDACEIGVDGYVGDGKIEIVLPHTKYTYSVDGVTIPSGHSFPYEADAKLQTEIEKQITLAAQALGLRNCPFNADVFVKDDKVWIIEMGGRTGATCIPELISIYEGYDWYEKIIHAALGETMDFPKGEKTPCMAKLLFSDVNGRIAELDENILSKVKEQNMIVHLDYKVGDHVDAVHNGTDRIGHIIMTKSAESDMDENIQRIMKAIKIKKDEN